MMQIQQPPLNHKIIVENEFLLSTEYHLNLIQNDYKFLDKFKIVPGEPLHPGSYICMLDNPRSSKAIIQQLIRNCCTDNLQFSTSLTDEFMQFFDVREHLIQRYETLGHVFRQQQHKGHRHIQSIMHRGMDSKWIYHLNDPTHPYDCSKATDKLSILRLPLDLYEDWAEQKPGEENLMLFFTYPHDIIEKIKLTDAHIKRLRETHVSLGFQPQSLRYQKAYFDALKNRRGLLKRLRQNQYIIIIDFELKTMVYPHIDNFNPIRDKWGGLSELPDYDNVLHPYISYIYRALNRLTIHHYLTCNSAAQ